MPQMFTSSFFRRDVQPPPPQPEHPLSPVSIIQRPNSHEKSPESTREAALSQIQIPEPEKSLDNDNGNEEKRDKARKAAKYLKLIVHCQRCNGKCNTIICKKTRLLLNHCAPCQKREKCPIKGCFQTKKLLCHMIACKIDRKQAKESGIVPKECNICSAVENNIDDDPQDNHSPDSGREHSLDMDGFTRPMLPRRFRSNTQVNAEPLSSQSMSSIAYNCRSFSVEEGSEEMEEDDGGDIFRSRRVSI
mmetsp:Transcript_17966/g.30058  ORF Transcript_17966/g.30058 Transcript_17966/m.30058 type:complete len:247 (+) Transcript_17966:20-760(+)|eukprot:CAMPEP_0114434906 /NCGR_PEP_ID=MMETSP0103-20121206/12527_1 /TAXON_ID=37642 ORGANISM="Paraphysomonas imperforata, Strain PA2" /NCGR_SAMPLE_ID=MMETSP0103 /ASSEMBLY_ACC=CAM_ASM_000201 /LENGTH=246 /DNA_ID=CAMNT_0001604857 /DNA_START=20 /DNA_END=760 /DNA_ORIENTATION=+